MATIKCTVQRSSWYEVYFEYSYTQDSILAKTTLTHALKLKQLTDGYDFDTVASVTVGYAVAGQTFSKTQRININDKGGVGYTIVLASGSSTIAHSDEGVGSFTVSVDTAIESGGHGPGTIKLATKTVSLPTIYRASVPTLSSSTVKMGNALIITTNRKSASFKHTLKYTFGGTTATITTEAGASYTWMVPDLASKCNNAVSGTATITCITYNGSTKIGETNCTVTLTVPAVTTPVFTNGDVIIGSSNPIQTNAASANFTHIITYSFNGKTGNVNTTPTKSGIVWQTPAELASYITSTSGEGTITCNTYNGTAKVDFVTVKFKAIVPNTETFQPKVSGFSVAPYGTLPSAFDGLYIQGKSGVQASFTASSTYSPIASYKLTADGRNFFGNPAKSSAFTRSGNFTVTGTVTDNRGFSRVVSKDVTVIPYSKPSIVHSDGYSAIVCERSLQDGTYDDAGTHLHIKCKRDYYPVIVNGVQKNTCSLKYQYKMAGGSWSSMVTLLDGSNTATDDYDGNLANVVSQANKSYTIRLIVTDTIGSSETYEFSIPTADVTMHLGEGGYGVAFGKYSDATSNHKMVEFADDWDLVMDGQAVTDFVVEQGVKKTTATWFYRKWNSGRCELYGNRKANIGVTVQSGNAYRSELISDSLPFTLYDIICVVDCSNINSWASSNTATGSSNYTSVSYVMWRGAQYEASDFDICIHITGRWK